MTVRKTFLLTSPNKKINNNALFVGDYFNYIGTNPNGEILSTAYGGFNVFEHNGRITHRIDILNFPIHSDLLQGIVGTKENLIFFGTTDGLYIYNPQKNAVYGFTERQGLPYNDVTHAFYLANDSMFYVGMENSWCAIALNRLTHTRLLQRLQFTSIQLDNKYINTYKKIYFNPDNNNLKINFSALTYQHQEQIQYRYKYSFDDKWIHLGN